MKKLIKYAVLATVPALAVAVGAGSEISQAGATATASDGPRAVAHQAGQRPRIILHRSLGRGICITPDGRPLRVGTTNELLYNLLFTPYDRGDEALMAAEVQHLVGSPPDMRDCPRSPNLQGTYKTVRFWQAGERRPMEEHWRQGPNRSERRADAITLRLKRLTHGRHLDPGIYRVRIRANYSPFGSGQADFEFAVMDDSN